MIVVFGTVCLDRIRYVPHLPEPGAYIEVDSETLALGGEAANTASHLRRWNADAELRGNALAGDAPGVLLEALLAEHGLAYKTRAETTDATPVCDVYVTPDGERTMFGLGFRSMVVPDPGTFLSVAGSWFTSDGNLGEQGERHASKAQEGGMRLYLMDLGADSLLLGPGVIWQSSTRWVGKRGDDAANESVVQEVVSRTGCTAILTDSSRGVLVGSPEAPIRRYPVFPRTTVSDPTGAGDAFRAGMLYGLDHGWPMGECLSFGAAAASLAAEFVGAAEGPTLRAIEAHLSTHADIASQYA